MRGSVKSQVGHVLSLIDGIGTSKLATRSTSDLRDITGTQQISGLIHSYESYEAIFTTVVALTNFAKENFGVKDITTINNDIVKAFIESKITDGISRETAKNYISYISKFGIALEKFSQINNKEYQAFNRNILQDVRNEVLNIEKNQHINRAYADPKTIVTNLSDKYQIVAQLQLDYGLRITEASHITTKQLVGTTLTIQGKGGYWQTKELSQDLVDKIKDHMQNGVFHANQNNYRNALKESAIATGQNYTGSHGLRYNYAQSIYLQAYKINLSRGMTVTDARHQAKLSTSNQIGHHRAEITSVYLQER